MSESILTAAKAAKAASRRLANLDTQCKNDALQRIALAIEGSSARLLKLNCEDVADARKLVDACSLSSSALSRLALNEDKIRQMSAGVRAVAALQDPVGHELFRSELDDGLELRKITCPFGVLAAIVEARPDAVVQLAALALKSGNALMIKAGAEISRTSAAIVDTLRDAVAADDCIPASAFTHVEGREAVRELLTLTEYIDLVVPRGSADLIRFVAASSRIPVLGHADGVCHIYVDRAANQQMAVSLVIDAKTQAPSTCNAVETVLVDETIAPEFIPVLVDTLHAHGVTTRGCERTRAIFPRHEDKRELFCEEKDKDVEAVADSEWHREYGNLTIAIRVVAGIDSAIDHIERFGSRHTDCIVTEDRTAAQRFLREVDSAGVFHNVSTRFSDGYRYGFGAEVGISTSKLHARGPVGLEGLVSYKYLLSGTGQRVSEYSGAQARRFRHETKASRNSSSS